MPGWRNKVYWTAIWLLGTIIVVLLAVMMASLSGGCL
jgi:hypothetical protein